MLKKFITFASEQKDTNFIYFLWSNKVIKFKKQIFAVFGDIAYDVTPIRDFPKDNPYNIIGKIFVPIKGRYFAGFPDEGTCGVMGCHILQKEGGIRIVGPCFSVCRWIYTKELEKNYMKFNKKLL